MTADQPAFDVDVPEYVPGLGRIGVDHVVARSEASDLASVCPKPEPAPTPRRDRV